MALILVLVFGIPIRISRLVLIVGKVTFLRFFTLWLESFLTIFCSEYLETIISFAAWIVVYLEVLGRSQMLHLSRPC